MPKSKNLKLKANEKLQEIAKKLKNIDDLKKEKRFLSDLQKLIICLEVN